jgi:hypothetical protein
MSSIKLFGLLVAVVVIAVWGDPVSAMAAAAIVKDVLAARDSRPGSESGRPPDAGPGGPAE